MERIVKRRKLTKLITMVLALLRVSSYAFVTPAVPAGTRPAKAPTDAFAMKQSLSRSDAIRLAGSVILSGGLFLAPPQKARSFVETDSEPEQFLELRTDQENKKKAALVSQRGVGDGLRSPKRATLLLLSVRLVGMIRSMCKAREVHVASEDLGTPMGAMSISGP